MLMSFMDKRLVDSSPLGVGAMGRRLVYNRRPLFLSSTSDIITSKTEKRLAVMCLPVIICIFLPKLDCIRTKITQNFDIDSTCFRKA